jgi:class 3 adenylate cyclase
MTTTAPAQRRATHDVQRPAETMVQDGVRQYSRRNATFLFTDIVGSTELLTLLGEDVWLEALREHNDVVINAVELFGGTYLKFLGDGWMIAFTCPRDAIDASVVIQRVLGQDPSPEGFRIRIGVHSGMPMLEEDEFVGKDVVLAARIAREAGPGEILASSDVVDAIGPHDARFDGGRIADLKGLGPHLVFGVEWERGGR